MKIMIVVIACIIVLYTGFWIMKKIDIFIGNNSSTMYRSFADQELVVGFDMPFLAENFISKLCDFTKDQDEYKFRLCSADAGELSKLLDEQKIDCALIASDSIRWVDDRMQCRNMTLIPQHLRMNCYNTTVEPVVYQEKTVRVIWYPENKTEKKKYLNDILLKLVDDKS
ncbi:MAG: hypothetical protein PHW34_06960 [Hespellia sp.]|nr:hypothetical protein [Hespellia sp.]